MKEQEVDTKELWTTFLETENTRLKHLIIGYRALLVLLAVMTVTAICVAVF